MNKKIVTAAASFLLLTGCVTQRYNIGSGLESNKNTQVIVNDFMDYLRTVYKRGTWVKIEGGDGNLYISKLRSTAIKKGLKVCINKCPVNAATFETEIEIIDGNLLEATLSTPKSIFHRIYKIDKYHKIRRFGNKTIYKRQ